MLLPCWSGTNWFTTIHFRQGQPLWDPTRWPEHLRALKSQVWVFFVWKLFSQLCSESFSVSPVLCSSVLYIYFFSSFAALLCFGRMKRKPHAVRLCFPCGLAVISFRPGCGPIEAHSAFAFTFRPNTKPKPNLAQFAAAMQLSHAIRMQDEGSANNWIRTRKETGSDGQGSLQLVEIPIKRKYIPKNWKQQKN